MNSQHHIIYVPGIADDAYHIQSLSIKSWRLHGLHGHLHAMPWLGSEEYESKHTRLLTLIDELAAKGHTVSLVGASAGASAIINAYVERPDKITKLVHISGKINNPENVGEKIYRENPAFRLSLYRLQASLNRLAEADKAKMLLLYPVADNIVPHEDAVIPGVAENRLAVSGHGFGIVDAITVQFYLIARFLKM